MITKPLSKPTHGAKTTGSTRRLFLMGSAGIAALALLSVWAVTINRPIPEAAQKLTETPTLAVPSTTAAETTAPASTGPSAYPSAPGVNIVREEDGYLIDATVDEAEIAERYDDPYEYNEATGPTNTPELDHSGSEYIETAAEEEVSTAAPGENTEYPGVAP